VCVHGGDGHRELCCSGNLALDGVKSRLSGVEAPADRGGLFAHSSDFWPRDSHLSPALDLRKSFSSRPHPRPPLHGLSLIEATARNRKAQPASQGPSLLRSHTLNSSTLSGRDQPPVILVPCRSTAAASPLRPAVHSCSAFLRCV
jgi:hypothetical protein